MLSGRTKLLPDNIKTIIAYLEALSDEQPNFYNDFLNNEITGRLFFEIISKRVPPDKIDNIFAEKALVSDFNQQVGKLTPLLVSEMKEKYIPAYVKLADDYFKSIAESEEWKIFWGKIQSSVSSDQLEKLYDRISGAVAYKILIEWSKSEEAAVYGDERKVILKDLTKIFNNKRIALNDMHVELYKKMNTAKSDNEKIQNAKNTLIYLHSYQAAAFSEEVPVDPLLLSLAKRAFELVGESEITSSPRYKPLKERFEYHQEQFKKSHGDKYREEKQEGKLKQMLGSDSPSKGSPSLSSSASSKTSKLFGSPGMGKYSKSGNQDDLGKDSASPVLSAPDLGSRSKEEGSAKSSSSPDMRVFSDSDNKSSQKDDKKLSSSPWKNPFSKKK